MKMQDELITQIDRIVQLVEAFDIPAITAEGYEADDILGTLAKRAADDHIEALIVTGDTDAFQLIGPRIKVLTSGRQFNDTAIYDEKAVKDRYQLKPIQLIDYKALKGDTSDNVPGVKGIGEKTAVQLLEQYGTVENIYKHLDKVEPARAKAALEANRAMAFLSKDLVTIRTDVPLSVKWDDCSVHSYNRSKVEALFDELEFKTLRNRLPDGGVKAEGAAEAGMAPSTRPAETKQISMFGEEPVKVEAVKINRPSITQTTIIQDETALKALAAELKQAEAIAFDTETTSTDPLLATIVGLSLAIRAGEGYYIPIGHAAGQQLPLEQVVRSLKPIIENKTIAKVGHNAKFDLAVLHRIGIDARNVTFDTMLAAFLIEPGGQLGLKKLAMSQFKIEMTEILELIGKGKKQISMDQVAIEDAAPYAAADADI